MSNPTEQRIKDVIAGNHIVREMFRDGELTALLNGCSLEASAGCFLLPLWEKVARSAG
jgi:hypothetical protein